LGGLGVAWARGGGMGGQSGGALCVCVGRMPLHAQHFTHR
jgi:hypothetical protein